MQETVLPVNFITVCSGDGYWSHAPKRKVRLTALVLCDHTDTWDGETYRSVGLEAYYDEECWKASEDGLIYTDPLWIQTLRQELIFLGFSKLAVEEVEYSEQGWQDAWYVHMDAGVKFAEEFYRLNHQLTQDLTAA